MSIQIMEHVKRLSRQLAAAEERIRALENASAPREQIEAAHPAIQVVINEALAEHVAERHTPGRKRTQAED